MNLYLSALCRRLFALAIVVAMSNTLMVAPASAQTLVVQEFCNTTPISIPEFGAGSPYPSPITVPGGVGNVVSVTATFKGFSHTYPRDVDIMLSGPTPSTNLLLLSDLGNAGPTSSATDLAVTFDDQASTEVPAAMTSGTFRPTNFPVADDNLQAPAPAWTGATTLSTFAGSPANGTWNLWARDQSTGDGGSIAGGWCLKVTTAPPIDGTCGSAHATTPLQITAPSANLCTQGSASTVGSDLDAYRWSCSGTNGGSPASCKAPRGYTITPNAGANGNISPNTPQVVAFHETPAFTVTANAGYSASASGCSGSLIGNTFTASAVTDDCAVAASFTGNDSVPGAFGFVTQVGVGISTLITSNTITLTGLTAAANISITTNSEYQVNGGSFVTAPGTVNNGNTITVRHNSSPNFLTQVTTRLTVGTVLGTFNSTTLAPPAVNGVCGSSHSTGSTPLLTTPPVSNLCSVGNSIMMHTGLAAYRWSCTGTNGGNPASCGAPRGYTVTPSAGSNGSISPSTAQVVAYHAAPAFSVTANSGYSASASGCNGTLTATTYMVGAVTANCAVNAAFAQKTYVISATSSPSNAGTVTCTPTPVQHGANATCTAIASVGFVFTGFTGGCTGNTCLLSNVVSETAVTANFVGTYTVGGTVSGMTGAGLTLQLNLNPATNLTINANGSFTFPTLLNDGSKFKVALITQPPGQVCSIFAAKGTLYGANNTGVTVTCAASAVTSVTGTIPDTKGVTSASVTGGGTGCGFLHASFVSAASVASTPPGVQFPFGVLDFDTVGCNSGSTITVTVTYPQALNPNSQYWKYGRRPGSPTASWYVLPATITGNKVVFSITDGGLGDDDTTVNGVIVDPGGPGLQVSDPVVPVVPVVPLVPALPSLPVLPGVGSNGLTVLNLGAGAGPSITGCLRTTLNDLLGPDWLYQGQTADGGSRLGRANEIISFYTLDANSNTTYGLGQGSGIYLRVSNPLSVVTDCGTLLTVPAMYNLGEFGAFLQAAGLSVQINAQGVMTVQVGSLIYAARPDYLVTQGTPGAPALTTGPDGRFRFTDSAGHSQILYPAFLEPETLGSQVSQAVGGWTVIQTDGTALVTLLNGQKFVLTPDLALGTVPPEIILAAWWQDGPNHYRLRHSGFSNTSQGFSVMPR